jgi:hypothetical protein
MADVLAESSPATEDKFYNSTPGVSAASPTETIESSATPVVKTGAVQTEAAPEPADIELEPTEGKTDKSAKSNWATMRAARYRAEAERDLLKKQLDERKAEPLTAAAAAVIKTDPEKPKSEDFATYDLFLDARDKYNRAAWETEQTRKRTDAEAAEAKIQQQAESAKHLENWNKNEAAVTAKHATYGKDFDAFFAVAKSNPALAGAVFESELGPDLAQHLGVTPAELTRIAALPQRSIWKEIGKLEDRLTSKGSEPTVTKAPRPLAKVDASAARPEKDRSMEDRFYTD